MQKCLDMMRGFPGKSADVCLAQYEAGRIAPKAELTASSANIPGVSPQALAVSDIDAALD